MEVIDFYGRNAIVICPDCRGPYLVCEDMDKRGPRKCPYCNAANGFTFSAAQGHRRYRNRKQLLGKSPDNQPPCS